MVNFQISSIAKTTNQSNLVINVWVLFGAIIMFGLTFWQVECLGYLFGKLNVWVNFFFKS
jgi:hypothetical protein